MLARRIVAKHVTGTTALAMLGATAVLAGLQVLFTYLGELGSLKEGYGAWQALKYVLRSQYRRALKKLENKLLAEEVQYEK